MSKPEYIYDFEMLKEHFDIVEVAKHFGFQPESKDGNVWRCVSTIADSHNITALCIDTSKKPQVFKDFKGDTGGDVIDFVATVLHGTIDKYTRVEAAKYLYQLGGLTPENCKYDAKRHEACQKARAHFVRKVEQYHEFLINAKNEDVRKLLDYLHERGITDETIRRRKIGICKRSIDYAKDGISCIEPRLFLPYFDRAGIPVYGINRRLDWCCHSTEKGNGSKYMKTKTTDFIKNSICGVDTLARRKEDDYSLLVIPEGFFDWLSFEQEGFHCLSPITGSFSHEQEQEVFTECQKYRRIVTAFDIDGESEAGQKFTFNFCLKAFKQGFVPFYVKSYGQNEDGSKVKDVSEYYQAKGDLHKLVTECIESGAIYVASRLNAEFNGLSYNALSVVEKRKLTKSVREFLSDVKKLLTKNELEAVLTEIKKYMPDDALAEATREKKEAEIIIENAEAFLKDYPYLSFYGSAKHGTYFDYTDDLGVWQPVEDASIHSRIFDKFRDTRVMRITDIVRMSVTPQRADKNILPDFNKKQLINMPNSVLELDTGILREHRPDDNVTHCLTFNYDEKATCPMFDKLLYEVTAGEQSRINHIWDSWAYNLVNDCRYEKAFCWIGEGANGKSTLFRILEALFSNANRTDKTASVTHVQPKDFADATKRIQLRHSLLNIAYDIDFNLAGTESYIKSLTSGDAIDGNRKFKDTDSFVSRAKLFMASNDTPVFRDTSLAITRRIMFCKFVVDFTGREDTTLAERIIATELPGIFNKLYQAYKELLQRGFIRESCDQAECSKEMQEIANPILSFWYEKREQYIQAQWLFRPDVYMDYENWCIKNHFREILSMSNFSRIFVRLKELKDLNKGERKKFCQEDKKQYRIFTFAPETKQNTSRTEAEAVADKPKSTLASFQYDASQYRKDTEAEAEAVSISEPFTAQQQDTEAEVVSQSEQFTQDEIDAIEAYEEEFEDINDTVKRYIHEGLLIQTLEYYMKFITLNEAMALYKIFGKLNRVNEAEIARKIWVTKRNAQERA